MGSIQSHDFLRDAVIVSEDAGQFVVGQHALWIHAKRLIHKLATLIAAADPSLAWPRPAPSWLF